MFMHRTRNTLMNWKIFKNKPNKTKSVFGQLKTMQLQKGSMIRSQKKHPWKSPLGLAITPQIKGNINSKGNKIITFLPGPILTK